jgi:hypothetical protein
MRACLWARQAVIAAACVWAVPRPAVADPARPPQQSGAPVTLTAIGDRLVISGDDPAAVERAYELARMLVEDKTQESRAFHLQYADATEVAPVLDEWFNGPPKRSSNPALSPLVAALMQRGRGGRNAPPPPPPPPPPRVHVVAVPESNSLLVRGSALDLLSVQHVLETALDVEPGEVGATMKPFVIGPLHYAVATEVVRVLKDVYQQDLDQATVRSSRRAARGRRPGQPLDPSGRPRPISLTLAADDRTNSVVGMAPGSMEADLRALIGVLEDKARVDTKVTELVPPIGIDPDLFQQVITAIQAKLPTTNSPRTGSPTPPRGR